MTIDFYKMHGLGNDYVYVDLFAQKIEADWPELARQVSPRQFGVGSDGLILICPGQRSAVRMRIFNADGSEAQMCGNGLRCAARYAYEHGLLDRVLGELPEGLAAAAAGWALAGGQWRSAPIETRAGILTVALHVVEGNRVDQVGVDMGRPILEAARIPTTFSAEMVVAHPFDLPDGQVRMTCVSMGNPHAVIFTDRLDDVDLERIGPYIENHERFPERINVHFAKALGRDRVKVLTWERGSGRTMACGTGACAVAVAGGLEGRLDGAVVAELPGGELRLLWNRRDDHVYMLGPATIVFEGTWLGPV